MSLKSLSYIRFLLSQECYRGLQRHSGKIRKDLSGIHTRFKSNQSLPYVPPIVPYCAYVVKSPIPPFKSLSRHCGRVRGMFLKSNQSYHYSHSRHSSQFSHFGLVNPLCPLWLSLQFPNSPIFQFINLSGS